MIRIATPMFLLCALALLPGSASPARLQPGMKQLFGIAAANAVVIPQEWGGIWTYADSTYDCVGELLYEDAGSDTLCPGAVVVEPAVFPVVFDCTGGADATTVNVVCTGSAEVFANCLATYSLSMHGTRTGDTYFVVSTTRLDYSGTAIGCDLIPDECTQTNTHGTRTGPTPIEYCQTPALPRSWGDLKVRYR